jgi:single-strand DNA-binding protein
MDYNRIILAGRLTRDPELKYTAEGDPFCKFRIAVNPRGPQKQSSKPLFLEVFVWKANAEACGEHLSKGQQVLLDGSLQQREWTNEEGMKSAILQVFAERVEFGPKPRGQNGGTRPPVPAVTRESEEVPF